MHIFGSSEVSGLKLVTVVNFFELLLLVQRIPSTGELQLTNGEKDSAQPDWLLAAKYRQNYFRKP